jgi:hypothetical protein
LLPLLLRARCTYSPSCSPVSCPCSRILCDSELDRSI